MSEHIHTLLVLALLVPYCAIALGLLIVIGAICWRGARYV